MTEPFTPPPIFPKGEVIVTDSVGVSDSVDAVLTTTKVEGQSSVSADLSVLTEPTVPLDDLPTEVIAEVFAIGINLLPPPDPNDVEGQWVLDVGIGDHHVPLGVGSLQDELIEAMLWIERFVLWVQEGRRSEGDDS